MSHFLYREYRMQDFETVLKQKEIIQQNELVSSAQNFNLRSRQMLYCAQLFRDPENPDAEIVIPGDAFLKFANANTSKRTWSSLSVEVEKISQDLGVNPIKIVDSKNKENFIDVHWVEYIGYKDGDIILKHTSAVNKLLGYKEGKKYTRLFTDLRMYNTNFTARLIDLFQYHHKPRNILSFEFSISEEDFRFWFLAQEIYKQWRDLRRRAINEPQAYLKKTESTPYFFEYSERREKRAVVEITFKVFVRPDIFQKLSPKGQTALLLPSNESTPATTETKKKVLKRLVELDKRHRIYSQEVLPSMTNAQAVAYFKCIEYGVNRNLACDLVLNYCSIGDIIGREHEYMEYVLRKIETDRLSRIEKHKANPDMKGRATPKEKRGGLVKKPIQEKYYFPEFMEYLSTKKAQEQKTPRSGTFTSFGDIVKKATGGS